MPDQAEGWKEFYIRAIDYLEALNTDEDRPDGSKRGWKQVKMFQGEDRKNLQTLVDNNTITPETQQTPKLL